MTKTLCVILVQGELGILMYWHTPTEPAYR